MNRIAIAAALLAATLSAACSNTAQTLLSTGSILGSSEKPEAAAPPPETPVDRALNVAATSARAQKCGYNFDPEKLKTDYLNYEVSVGLPADQLPGLAKSYDFAKASVAAKLVGEQNYCADERLTVIKADLTRHLAGDYAAPQRKQETASGGGWLEADQPEGKEKLNPDFLRDKRAPPTIRVD